MFLRETEASSKKKLITDWREGTLLEKSTMFLSFHKQNKAIMKRAPRPFLAIEQEWAEKEIHLSEAELDEEDWMFPFNSNQSQKEEAKGQRKNRLTAESVWEPQRGQVDASCTPMDWAQALVGSLLWNSFQAMQAVECLRRLFHANLCQTLGRLLCLIDSQAAENERWEELELDQIRASSYSSNK